MSNSKTFISQNQKWKCEGVFYSDRFEWSWDEWGLGVSKGKTVVQHEELSPHLTKSSNMGVGAKGPLITASAYAVLAIFSHALLPTPWQYIEFFFVAGFIFAGVRGIFRLVRKTESINIQLKSGNAVAAIITTKWSAKELGDFRSFYEKWIKEPDKALQP